MRLAILAVLLSVVMSGCVSAATIKDVAYGLDKDQTYDVYTPEGSAQGAPVMVMVHGGAWRIGDKGHRPVWKGKTAHWLPMGAVFISINYRMLPDADVGVQAQDVAAAVAHIQAYGAKAGWDVSRLVLMGHSAGAHLASLITVDTHYTEAVKAQPWLATISLDSGALNVPEIMGSKHFRFYDDAFGSDPEQWKLYSPLYRIVNAHTPMLMVCASPRKTACAQADAFASAMKAAGGRVDVLPINKSHGDVNEDLGTDEDYTAQVDAFLKQVGWFGRGK